MFKDYTLQTTWGRALFSLMTVVFILAGGTTLFEFFGSSEGFKYAPDSFNIYNFWVNKFTSYLLDFGAALSIGGIPIWFLAHRLGFRTWVSAIYVGFGFPFAFTVIAFAYQFLTIDGGRNLGEIRIHEILFPVLIFHLIGVAIALTIWRIAYRRPPPC